MTVVSNEKAASTVQKMLVLVRPWIYPGLTFISALLWYLNDAVRSEDLQVHLALGRSALLAVLLAAATNTFWRWLPLSRWFAVALVIVSILVSILIYSKLVSVVLGLVQGLSPTALAIIYDVSRSLILWSGLCAGCIFLAGGPSFRGRYSKILLLTLAGAFLAVLLAQI